MTLIGPPEYFNFAEDVVGKCASECPDRTALLSADDGGGETRWSFRLIHEESSRLAHVLLENGVSRGATVLLIVASLPFRVIAQLAVMKAGGVSVVVRSRSTSRELEHHIGRASPRVAVAGPEDAERLPAGCRVLALQSPGLV